jgi:hypothetical protein
MQLRANRVRLKTMPRVLPTGTSKSLLVRTFCLLSHNHAQTPNG